MYLTVYALLVVPLLLAPAGTWLRRCLAPAVASRALAASLAVSAWATAWALSVLAFGGLTSTREVLTWLARPAATLRAQDPVPHVTGLLAGLALAATLARLGRTVRRHQRARRDLGRLRDLPAAGDLIVTADTRPDAYALPGHPGRVVVTSSMLRALPADEQKMLLAHERAHLAFGHHRYALLADVAVALNPFLGGLRRDLSYCLERWADEHAADVVGSRTTAARSLARAALLSSAASAGPVTALGYLRRSVTARVVALQASAPVSRWRFLTPTAVLLTTLGAACADVTLALDRCIHVLTR